jgi:hypothetical protein
VDLQEGFEQGERVFRMGVKQGGRVCSMGGNKGGQFCSLLRMCASISALVDFYFGKLAVPVEHT